MDLSTIDISGGYEQVLAIIEQFAAYGPFAGILLTMIEAFFPPLPLVVFVTINVFAYGFWQGYIYSFIGTFVGSYIMFLLIRRFGKSHFANMIHRNKRFENLLHWIKDKGFMPVFILLTFPFTPSIIVCGLSGLADVRTEEYAIALFMGKLVMVFSLSFIGYNVRSFIEQPIRSVIFIIAIMSLSFIGKRFVLWYERKVEEHRLKKS